MVVPPAFNVSPEIKSEEAFLFMPTVLHMMFPLVTPDVSVAFLLNCITTGPTLFVTTALFARVEENAVRATPLLFIFP